MIMAEQSQIESPPSELSRRRRKARRIVVICLLAASAGSLIGWLLSYAYKLSYAYNNVSLTSDRAFARSLDTAIESSRKWVELNRERIVAKKNVALIRMLQDIDTMHADALYSGIVEAFMTGPARPGSIYDRPGAPRPLETPSRPRLAGDRLSFE